MHQSLKRVVTLMVVGLCGLCMDARADTVNFSHTWDGSEISGPNRLLRDSFPSVAGTAKTFPGIVAENPTYFVTTVILALPGTSLFVTPTGPQARSFLSAYVDSFDRLSLPTNYLGDQGSSDLAFPFSITVPASGTVVIVGNSVGSSDAINQSFSADITYTAVPLPLAVWAGLALLPLTCALRRRAACA